MNATHSWQSLFLLGVFLPAQFTQAAPWNLLFPLFHRGKIVIFLFSVWTKTSKWRQIQHQQWELNELEFVP